MKTRVGLITTMSQDKTWPDEVVAKVRNDHYEAGAALRKLGFDVITASEGLSRTTSDMERHGRILLNDDIEALIVYVGTWTYSNVVVNLASVVGLPVAIWTNSGNGNIGIVGAAISRGALDEVGIKNTLIHGGFDDAHTLEKIRVWCAGCAAVTKLKGTTLGVGGSRCMGMYTAHVDASEIKKKFGVDVDGWEQMLLIERAKAIPDDRARGFLEWMKDEFGGITASENAVLAQIKMYLALSEFIEEKRYDFVAVKCLPELPELHTTFCLAHALLNGSVDANGPKEPFVCACEADANGALTMQMLKNVSGKSVLFADFLSYDAGSGMATLCNCGSHPIDFACCNKDIYWVKEGLIEFNWKIGGACPQCVAKPGVMTLSRLSRIDGEYVMLIIKGQALEYPREKLAEVNPQQPQAFVRLECDPDDFFADLRCNHIHAVYGDYAAELVTMCELLNVRPIVKSLRKA